eukprot:4995817-Amphidinium_carterae.1
MDEYHWSEIVILEELRVSLRQNTETSTRVAAAEWEPKELMRLSSLEATEKQGVCRKEIIDKIMETTRNTTNAPLGDKGYKITRFMHSLFFPEAKI